jgi:hypothetical protein
LSNSGPNPANDRYLPFWDFERVIFTLGILTIIEKVSTFYCVLVKIIDFDQKMTIFKEITTKP